MSSSSRGTSCRPDEGISPELLIKRKREDMEDRTLLNGRGSGEETLQSDIWFDDGNVILEAQRTQFRVHRGVLSKYSTAFRELPYPEHDCPIVELSETAEDLHYLLEALYEWSFQSSAKLTLPHIVALIRLGHKYRITKVRRGILERLKEEWPMEYDQWISRSRPTIKAIEHDDATTIILQVLAAARECNMESILPALYLNVLSVLSLDEIENGYTSTDGSKITLPAEERLRVVTGLIRLRYALSTKGWSALNSVPAPKCLQSSIKGSEELCYKTKLAIYTQEFRAGDDQLQGIRPQLLPLPTELRSGLCTVCSPAALEFDQSRKELWDMLPSFFKLPDWDILRKEA